MARIVSLVLILAFVASSFAFPTGVTSGENSTVVVSLDQPLLIDERLHHGKQSAVNSTNEPQHPQQQAEFRAARQIVGLDSLGPIGDAILRSVLPAVVEQVLPAIAKMASQAALQAGPLVANMMRDSGDPQLNAGGALDIGALINALLGGFADAQRSTAVVKPTPAPTTTENPLSGFLRLFQE